MASTKLYDLCVKLYSFTRPDGSTGNKYANIGTVMQNDDGGKFLMIDRHFNPAGVPNPDNRTNIVVSMFEPRDPNQANANGFNQAPPSGFNQEPPSGFNPPPQNGFAQTQNAHPARAQPAHTQAPAQHGHAQAYGALGQPANPLQQPQHQAQPQPQQGARDAFDDDIPF